MDKFITYLVCVLLFRKALKAELTAKVPWPIGRGIAFWSDISQSYPKSLAGRGPRRAPAPASAFTPSLIWLLVQCLIILLMIFSVLYQVRNIYEHVRCVMFRKNISRTILRVKECPRIQNSNKGSVFPTTTYRILNWNTTCLENRTVTSRNQRQVWCLACHFWMWKHHSHIPSVFHQYEWH